MKLEILPNKQFIRISEATDLELQQIQHSFTKKMDNWFILKKKNPYIPVEFCFFQTEFNIFPYGLWKELLKVVNKYELSEVQIEKGLNAFKDLNFNKQDFLNWVDEYFKDSEIKPRDYQIESALSILTYKCCSNEISTGGGKTFIAFMIFQYLYDREKIKQFLYVTPSVSLITQTEEKFYQYAESTGHRPNWKSECVFGGVKKTNKIDSNIIFATYQSLNKKPKEYFENIDAILVDEAHHISNSASHKKIILSCKNANYKIGLTGTMPKEGSYNSFNIQAYLGPTVYNLTSKQLIDEKNATPVKIAMFYMDYLSDELKEKMYKMRSTHWEEKDGLKLLNLEKKIIRENRDRFLYICNIISKSKKNSLCLFADVQGGYGKKIYDWMRENTDKNVYYMDGETKSENREYYKERLEKDDNVLLISSIGTFSEGLDVKNIHTIFVVEPSKSPILVSQQLGRGMRLSDGKEFVTLIDFVDNFIYEKGDGSARYNYLVKHAKEREQLYKRKKFPFKIFNINLKNKALF